MKKLLAGLAAASLTLFAAGCGSDSDSSSDTTVAVVETAPAETTPAETVPAETTPAETMPAETMPAETTPAAAPADTTPAADAAAAPAGTTYTLLEWDLEGPATLTAGTQDISAVNGGKFPHELLILKGTYAELPKDDLGTILEDQLAPDVKVAEIERFNAGETKTASVTLEPGNYVFVCNIAVGPNSHAGKGQVLDVVVA